MMSDEKVVAVASRVFAQWRRDHELSERSLADLARICSAGFRWELLSRARALVVSREEAVAFRSTPVLAAADIDGDDRAAA